MKPIAFSIFPVRASLRALGHSSLGSTFGVMLSAAFAVLGGAQLSLAEQFTNANGDFSLAGNWSPASVPTGVAVIANSPAVTANLTDGLIHSLTGELYVGATEGDGTLWATSGTITQAGAWTAVGLNSTGVLNVNGGSVKTTALNIGWQNTSSGTVTLSSGLVAPSALTSIGSASVNATGTLNVSGTGTFNAGSSIFVGYNGGTGYLNISGGYLGIDSIGAMNLGLFGGSNGHVVQSGGTVHIPTDWLNIGAGGGGGPVPTS